MSTPLFPPHPQTVPIAALHVQDGERVIGTHVFPLCLFGWPFDLTTATEVTRTYDTPVDGLEVLLTRMGGLFVRVPEHLIALDRDPGTGARPRSSHDSILRRARTGRRSTS